MNDTDVAGRTAHVDQAGQNEPVFGAPHKDRDDGKPTGQAGTGQSDGKGGGRRDSMSDGAADPAEAEEKR